MTEFDYKHIKNFIESEISPKAAEHDQQEALSQTVIQKIAAEGFLGVTVPKQYGGGDANWSTLGRLCLEFGKSCTAVRNLITVQHMVTEVIAHYGDESQKEKWLPPLASGEKIAAFALTEPNYGSDASGITTAISRQDDSFLINGTKRWISFGQIADLILTFGKLDGRPCCILIEGKNSAISVSPISGILGSRGSMLAELKFVDCMVPEENIIGKTGLGLHPATFAALDIGRYTISCGCVGMAEACLEASVNYSKKREQFGKPLAENQLIQKLITDMIVDVKAAKLLCQQAGELKDAGDRKSMRELLITKYFAANMAIRVTGKAVQLHGASGYSKDQIVERFYRDAKTMETIEGSNQMMQVMIAKYGYKNYFDEDEQSG